MVKELCFRCKRPVYPTDKVGPLKDGTHFHHGCFKCYTCGTRLALRTYFNNRNNTEDQEVYCQNHVPQAGPHDPVPHRSNIDNTEKLSSSNTSHHSGSLDESSSRSPRPMQNGGWGDIKIQHALKATAVQRPYPKITHAGAKYVVVEDQLDYDDQLHLETQQRMEEDGLYNIIDHLRKEEERKFEEETKEEWERALQEYVHKQTNSYKGKDDLIKHLTVKRDRKRETMHAKRKERERGMTADLVDKQSREMLDLFRQARQTTKIEHQTTVINEEQHSQYHKSNGHLNGNGHSNGSAKGYANGHTNGHTNGHANGQANGEKDVLANGRLSAQGDTDSSIASYPPTPPPPYPPSARKKEVYTDTGVFEAIDNTAIKVAESEVQTFTELVRALLQFCRSDVDRARAIYRWITIKNLNNMDFNDRLDSNTPMGLLRGIKYGTESYHVLFKRLCSYAGLHCVVIKGYSKSAGYQPSMRFEDNRFRNTWNAVFLDGSWRFVQCNWGARHLVNAKDIPPSGHRADNGRSENLRYEYDDHYFMTDPEEFIYEFFPNQPEWQLLKRPISLAEFEELPFVRSLFFRYGLSFNDQHLRAVVYADKTGAATIAINMEPESVSSLIFHYNLRTFSSEETEHQGVSLKRFVMQSVVGNSVVFRVHTPCRGQFLLDIFANAVSAGEYLTGQPMKFKSVCKFKVVCDHLNVIMVPLPECASGEWGPAKAFRLFGLVPQSHEDAIINSTRELQVSFKMTKPLAEFVASLHKNKTDSRRLARGVAHSVRGNIVTFRVHFPEEGQYGLDVYTRENSTQSPVSNNSQEKHLLTHCCKYLINARLS